MNDKGGINQFKEAVLEGGEFSDKELQTLKTPEDILALAQQHGYDLQLEDLESDEISDDILYSVAGGEKSATLVKDS